MDSTIRSPGLDRAQLELPLPLESWRVSTENVADGQTHTIAGLFAGIGGFECGMHAAGHSTNLLCENESGAKEVLRAHLGDIPLHDDVVTLRSLPSDTTLLIAGFPCQDLSQAGATKGIEGSRSGLVGEVFRLIRQHATPWVLLENVPFMLQLSGGRAMEVITSTFESLGYKWAYRVVDSRAFGLPQRRRRVYFLATLEGDPRSVLMADEAGAPEETIRSAAKIGATAKGFYWTEGIRGLGWADDAIPTLKGGSTIGIPSAPAILLPSGEVVLPDIRDAERLQGFPPEWTKPAERVTKKGSRWKLVGNAVTVPVSQWIGSRLLNPGPLAPVVAHPMHGLGKWPSAAWNLGDGRHRVAISEWPVQRPYLPLTNFLCHPGTPLSARATAGFLSRTKRSQLNFPPGFLDALRAHLSRVTEQ